VLLMLGPGSTIDDAHALVQAFQQISSGLYAPMPAAPVGSGIERCTDADSSIQGEVWLHNT